MRMFNLGTLELFTPDFTLQRDFEVLALHPWRVGCTTRSVITSVRAELIDGAMNPYQSCLCERTKEDCAPSDACQNSLALFCAKLPFAVDHLVAGRVLFRPKAQRHGARPDAQVVQSDIGKPMR